MDPRLRRDFRALPTLVNYSSARTNFRSCSGGYDITSSLYGLTVDDSDDAEDAEQQRSRAHLSSFFGGGQSPSALSLGERRAGRGGGRAHTHGRSLRAFIEHRPSPCPSELSY